MKTISALVYGKEYTLACDVGQEQHLGRLVSQVNARAYELEKAVGKLPEPLMLLYTALMVADELHDQKIDAARLRDQLAQAERQAAERGDQAQLAALEEGVAENLQQLANRLEGLALKLAS